jgi:2-isopropylmalate synthase
MNETNPSSRSIDFPQKYRPIVSPIDLADRRWPSGTITQAPIWCAVDLRDGNQALIKPMGHERKLRMFDTLVAMGFKEIEVGFPSASQTDFDFVRFLIETNHVPHGVAIQVLTQAREDLIRRTFDSLTGVKDAIVHLYNSTSELQRRVVFGLGRDGIRGIAVRGAELIVGLTRERGMEGVIRHEYSPESFMGTELDFSKEICEAVMDVYQPTPDSKLILNLPLTVEMATPNVYADQIEWMCRNIRDRDRVVISLHPHNDRGTGVAAAELALMAGADRVEGTLFGNGERTGNVCLVTLAANMMMLGIDPQLDVSNVGQLVRVAEYCNQLPVHPRHPYAGELVFTAFSGSHQDAISKGFKAREASGAALWEVPYLAVDPKDVGASYEAIIRINSQSGKGGIAYILEAEHGFELPRALQIEFSKRVQTITDDEESEVSSDQIWRYFSQEYLDGNGRFAFVSHELGEGIIARILDAGELKTVTGQGNGPVDGFVDAMRQAIGLDFDVVHYHEHAIGSGANASAIAYMELRLPGEISLFGVGIDRNIVVASLKAVLSGLNRVLPRPEAGNGPAAAR